MAVAGGQRLVLDGQAGSGMLVDWMAVVILFGQELPLVILDASFFSLVLVKTLIFIADG